MRVSSPDGVDLASPNKAMQPMLVPRTAGGWRYSEI